MAKKKKKTPKFGLIPLIIHIPRAGNEEKSCILNGLGRLGIKKIEESQVNTENYFCCTSESELG